MLVLMSALTLQIYGVFPKIPNGGVKVCKQIKFLGISVNQTGILAPADCHLIHFFRFSGEERRVSGRGRGLCYVDVCFSMVKGGKICTGGRLYDNGR